MPSGKAPCPRSVAIKKLIEKHCTKNNIKLEVFLKKGNGALYVQGEIPKLLEYDRKDVDNSLRRIRSGFKDIRDETPTTQPTTTQPTSQQPKGATNSTSKVTVTVDVEFASANKIAEPVATLSSGVNALSIDQKDDASSNDGERECPPPLELPPPCEYVEDVTVKRVVQGCYVIVVTKLSVESSLGITVSDSNWGEVKISGIEDGSPMGDEVETGMTVLVVNGTKVTSREGFLDVYGKCLGKVEIMVGPKNMTEAVDIIKTLDSEKKDLGLEKEGLEVRVRKLNQEKKDLDKDNQVLKVNVQELEGQVQHLRAVLIDKIRQKNKQLAEQVNLD